MLILTSLPPYLLTSLPVFLLTGSILQYAKAKISVAKYGSMVRVCHRHCQRVIRLLPCFISTSSLFDLFDLFHLFHVAEVESRQVRKPFLARLLGTAVYGERFMPTPYDSPSFAQERNRSSECLSHCSLEPSFPPTEFMSTSTPLLVSLLPTRCLKHSKQPANDFVVMGSYLRYTRDPESLSRHWADLANADGKFSLDNVCGSHTREERGKRKEEQGKRNKEKGKRKINMGSWRAGELGLSEATSLQRTVRR